RLGVTILCAYEDLRTARGRGKCRYQGGRRTNHQFRLADKIPGARNDFSQLSPRSGQPVHFPIARDQWNYLGCRHPTIPSRVRLSDPLWQSQWLALKPILLELQGVGSVTMVRAP